MSTNASELNMPLYYYSHCQFCGKLCNQNDLTTVEISGTNWNLCEFCVDFATPETATQILTGVHPNNIELAWGAILAEEWINDEVDYL